MRFAFVGGLDVPDWLLSEVFLLSKISAVRIRLLAAHIAQNEPGSDALELKLPKLLGEAVPREEALAVATSIHFILASAARYDVQGEVLAYELQQLGLPREHTDGIRNVFNEHRAVLQQRGRDRSLRLARLSSVRWRIPEDAGGAAGESVELELGLGEQPAAGLPTPPPKRLQLRMSADDLMLLQAELTRAKEALQGISS